MCLFQSIWTFEFNFPPVMTFIKLDYRLNKLVPNWNCQLQINTLCCKRDVATLCKAFAIIRSHSGISTLMKDNQYQNKNGRDLGIAYFLVFLTYVILGPGSETFFLRMHSLKSPSGNEFFSTPVIVDIICFHTNVELEVYMCSLL